MLLLVGLFIVVPIIEIWVIIQIGELIGLWPTVALLLADALLGALLLRHQGRGAWRRFNDAIAARRFPGREAGDGLLIAVGGTLLLTPGFVTDIFGLILLVPPTRALVRRGLRGMVARRLVVIGSPGGGPAGGPFEPSGAGETGPRSSSRPYDVEGTAEEIEPEDPQLNS